mgnify:CR=1 FL=1
MFSQIVMLNLLQSKGLTVLHTSNISFTFSTIMQINRYYTPAVSMKITCGKISSLVISIIDMKIMVPLFCRFQILQAPSELGLFRL